MGDGSIFRIQRRRPDGKVIHRWCAQVSIGPRTSRRFVTRTVDTRPEAVIALAELRAERAAGVDRTPQTVGAFLERWIGSVRNIRPNTRRGYRTMIEHHLVPTLGSVRLADLSPLHVEEALASLEPRVGAHTLRLTHATLRRALTHAVRQGLVSRNVASREYVDAPRVTVDEPDAFSRDEVRALLDVARTDRLAALYALAVGTGLRQGELLGLAWEDVDLDGGQLNIRKELVRIDAVYRRDELKTPESRRSVPLSASVVAALRAHRQRVIEEGFIPTATGPVFTNRSGGALNGSWLTHHTQKLYRAAGIRPLDFKALRATFASRLHEAGVPDIDIARLMGHTRTHVTKRHYIALAGRHQSALEAIEEMVG